MATLKVGGNLAVVTRSNQLQSIRTCIRVSPESIIMLLSQSISILSSLQLGGNSR